jgi:hypothetical protein
MSYFHVFGPRFYPASYVNPQQPGFYPFNGGQYFIGQPVFTPYQAHTPATSIPPQTVPPGNNEQSQPNTASAANGEASHKPAVPEGAPQSPDEPRVESSDSNEDTRRHRDRGWRRHLRRAGEFLNRATRLNERRSQTDIREVPLSDLDDDDDQLLNLIHSAEHQLRLNEDERRRRHHSAPVPRTRRSVDDVRDWRERRQSPVRVPLRRVRVVSPVPTEGSPPRRRTDAEASQRVRRSSVVSERSQRRNGEVTSSLEVETDSSDVVMNRSRPRRGSSPPRGRNQQPDNRRAPQERRRQRRESSLDSVRREAERFRDQALNLVEEELGPYIRGTRQRTSASENDPRRRHRTRRAGDH